MLGTGRLGSSAWISRRRRADERGRWDRRADVQRHAGFMVLRERQVGHRQRLFPQRAVLAVANHADNLSPGPVRAIDADPAADRIGVRELHRRGGRVEDDDRRPGFHVGVPEVAALHERDAERLEELRSDHVRVDEPRVVGGRPPALALRALVRRAPPFDVEAEHAGAAAEHRHPGDGRGLDAGEPAHALDRLPIELTPLRAGVAQEIDAERRRDQLVDVDAGIDRACRLQAAHEQARGNQQQQRQRDLADDQELLEIEARPALAERGVRALERRHEPGT